MKRPASAATRRLAVLDVAVPGWPTLASLQAAAREALACTRNRRPATSKSLASMNAP